MDGKWTKMNIAYNLLLQKLHIIRREISNRQAKGNDKQIMQQVV